MALYESITITEAGGNLITSQVLNGGEPITFTALAIGDGEQESGADNTGRTSLINELMRLTVETQTKTGNKVTLTARLATDSISTGIYHREIGIYAGDTLFAYGNTGAQYDYIPPAGENAATTKTIRITLTVGTANVEFAPLETSELVTYDGLENRMQTYAYPAVQQVIQDIIQQDGSIQTDIPIDDEYSSTSGNAQSGKAVYQALTEFEEKAALLGRKNTFTNVNIFNGTVRFYEMLRADGTAAFNGTSLFSGQTQFQNTTTFTGKDNTFAYGLKALPLGVKNALGQDAYGLSVTPTGGLQLWGVQFMQGDNWGDTALKMVHNEISLYSTTEAAIGFDYANIVHFRTFPNDGSAANGGQGAIYDFRAWQWDNDTHDTANANCPVQILKTNAGSLTGESVLNKNELDANYAPLTHTTDTESHVTAENRAFWNYGGAHQHDTDAHFEYEEKATMKSYTAFSDLLGEDCVAPSLDSMCRYMASGARAHILLDSSNEEEAPLQGVPGVLEIVKLTEEMAKITFTACTIKEYTDYLVPATIYTTIWNNGAMYWTKTDLAEI